jgi:hypothetical protein
MKNSRTKSIRRPFRFFIIVRYIILAKDYLFYLKMLSRDHSEICILVNRCLKTWRRSSLYDRAPVV